MTVIAANIFEIPLTPQAQTFAITLAGIQYDLTVYWNDPGQYWVLDLRLIDGTDILLGIPLVTGRDLLEQFRYLKIGGSLVVQSDIGVDQVPTFNNLGQQGHLYFILS